MRHLKEALIKQRGITKIITNKDKIFKNLNICKFDNDYGLYGIVRELRDGNIIIRQENNIYSNSKFYDNDLNYDGNKSKDILEAWEPDKYAKDKIDELVKKKLFGVG